MYRLNTDELHRITLFFRARGMTITSVLSSDYPTCRLGSNNSLVVGVLAPFLRVDNRQHFVRDLFFDFVHAQDVPRNCRRPVGDPWVPMSVYDHGDYDPKRGPSKDVQAMMSEVAYSSPTNESSDNHWSKRNKDKEGVCVSASHGDEEFESRGQE